MASEATAIAMPKLGMTMEEGTVVQWPLSLGDPVAKGQLVLVIESEKTEVEIEAITSGVFRHIYVEEGDTVPCGTLLGAITESAEAAFDPEAFLGAQAPVAQTPGESLELRSARSAPSERQPRPDRETRRAVAPAAKALAKKLGVDTAKVAGTGPSGRVTRQDVEAFASARESLVEVADGVSLEVLAEGSGDPVVLLPGLGTDVSAFARQTPMLTERFEVLGVNPRGVGLSDAPETAVYDVGRTAADAAATFEGAAHVVGASLGAAAALELALTMPERVRSLTLITPFVEASPRLLAVADGWCRSALETSPETLAATLLPWFFSPSFLADEGARARTVRGLAQTLGRVPAQTVARMSAGLAQWSGTRGDDLAKIAIPALVIAAQADLLTPGAEALAEAIPGCTGVVVPDAGHAVALEAPEAVNAAIEAHLRELAAN